MSDKPPRSGEASMIGKTEAGERITEVSGTSKDRVTEPQRGGKLTQAKGEDTGVGSHSGASRKSRSIPNEEQFRIGNNAVCWKDQQSWGDMNVIGANQGKRRKRLRDNRQQMGRSTPSGRTKPSVDDRPNVLRKIVTAEKASRRLRKGTRVGS